MNLDALWTRLMIVAMGLFSACGSDDAPSDAAGTSDAELDTSCPENTPPFDFGPTGLSATNESVGLKVYLETASDKPPLYGTNDWTIAFTDLAGSPASDAKLTWTCAWMPKHGHGSNPKSVVDLGDGRYELQRQNMAMQGGWEIQLWVDATGAGEAYEGGGVGINRSACTEPGTKAQLILKACVPR